MVGPPVRRGALIEGVMATVLDSLLATAHPWNLIAL